MIHVKSKWQQLIKEIQLCYLKVMFLSLGPNSKYVYILIALTPVNPTQFRIRANVQVLPMNTENLITGYYIYKSLQILSGV